MNDDNAAWGPYDTPETMYPELEYEDELIDIAQEAYEWSYGQ